MTEYPAKTKEEYLEFYRAKRSLFHRYIGLTFIFLVFSWVYILTLYLFISGIIDIPFYYNSDPILMPNIVLAIEMIWFLLLVKNIRGYLVPWILVLMVFLYLVYLLTGAGMWTILIYILFLPLLTIGIYYRCGLYNEIRDSEDIASHYSYNASEEHTAVILPHDSKRLFDGSDASAAYLLKKLVNKEAYQVYFCPTEIDILHVLQNPKIKGVWVFGHGSKNGVVVNDKFSLYSELMIELTDAGPILRDMPKKKYVYQCHCNGGNGISLPHYLLDNIGYLDENIKAMPNHRDRGFGDRVGKDTCGDKLVNISIGKWEPFACLRNLNSTEKNKRFIDVYISHQKK